MGGDVLKIWEGESYIQEGFVINIKQLLKLPEVRTGNHGGKWPWHRSEDKEQSNRKPDKHGFKFCVVVWLSLSSCGAYCNAHNCCNHNSDVLHTEKPGFPLMNCHCIVAPEIFDNGALYIQ